MRILPIALSVLMIFTPAYSAYASMLPTKGQIAKMGKQGGALVKTGAGVVVKVGKVGRALSPVGAIVWCASSKKCKDYVGDAVEIACDISGVCTAEHKDESDGRCVARFGDDKQTASGFLSSKTRTETKGDTTKEYTPSDNAHEHLIKQGEKAIASANKNYPDWRYYHGNYHMNIKSTNNKTGKSSTGKFEYYVQVWVKCGDLSDDDRRISDKELNDLAKKIAEKMDDDDIVNYYNTDYDDVTINNNHYYGDDIDNETNIDNQCQNNSCNEISKEIEKDVKNGKYDIDDVTPANCTIEESTGKYIACNMTIKNDEEENNTNKEGDTTNKDTNVTKKEDEEEPHFCKTSDLTKEACEFFDWVDDEPSEKQDKKVNIEDEEEEKLNKNRINLDEGCPPDQHISVSMPWGYSTTIEFTYKPYCDFARDLKPYMTATGAIVSMYIVGSCGRRL